MLKVFSGEQMEIILQIRQILNNFPPYQEKENLRYEKVIVLGEKELKILGITNHVRLKLARCFGLRLEKVEGSNIGIMLKVKDMELEPFQE